MIQVIGLGLDGQVSKSARDLLDDALVVAGGERLLDILDIAPHRRLALMEMDDFMTRLQDLSARQDVCVVADGDPLLFGLGATLLRYFPREELCFHPQVSALQAAAARLGLPWHDCTILSLHGRDQIAPVFAALTHERLVAVYTDGKNTPDALARALFARGVTGWRMHVAEALQTVHEQVFSGSLHEVAFRAWNPLNLVFLERVTVPSLDLCLGLDEADLAHQQNLVTKMAARALILSCLRLPPDALLWDLGAGSGAVSLEAAKFLRFGQIKAVERNPKRLEDIKENIRHLGAWLVEPVGADIEVFLAQSQAETRPSHIFVGGGASAEVLAQCQELLVPGGRLVVAAVLLSTLEIARHSLKSWPMRVHQLQHSVSQLLGQDMRLVPRNPFFLVEAQKPVAQVV